MVINNRNNNINSGNNNNSKNNNDYNNIINISNNSYKKIATAIMMINFDIRDWEGECQMQIKKSGT